ncbi:MAG: dihydroorotate dehydrogenase electron transfer subunit, partial [Candidatus Omnitrophota bacterium]
MVQTKSKIIKNIKVGPNYYKMALDASVIVKHSLPGQFLNVRVSEKYEPLLRRPFSIHRVLDSKIEILYEVIGKGTELLSHKKAGGKLDVLGPLGNGFDFNSKPMKKAILVAGGMGVA